MLNKKEFLEKLDFIRNFHEDYSKQRIFESERINWLTDNYAELLLNAIDAYTDGNFEIIIEYICEGTFYAEVHNEEGECIGEITYNRDNLYERLLEQKAVDTKQLNQEKIIDKINQVGLINPIFKEELYCKNCNQRYEGSLCYTCPYKRSSWGVLIK